MRKRSKGQSLAEFAIIFPVFMFMLGATIQFAVILWSQNTLNQVVRDAGRYGATALDCDPTTNADIVTKTGEIADSAGLLGTLTNVIVTLPTPGSDPCPPVSNTNVVWLTVQADAQVPVFFPWVPGNGAISSIAQFRMEPEVR